MGETRQTCETYHFLIFPLLSHRLRGSEKSTQRSKMGLWAKFEKKHNFDEISFSPIKSPPEGSEKSIQRSKIIKHDTKYKK